MKLLSGLKIVIALWVKQVQVFSDSLLVVNQVRGEYALVDEWMSQYYGLVRDHIKKDK